MNVIANEVSLADDEDIDGFLSFEIDGMPAASSRDMTRRKFSSEYFYSEEQAEKHILFSGLILARAFPESASKRESPDFEVVLKSARTVFVEITSAAADARRTNPIGDFNGGINEWITGERSALARVEGWHLIINIPIAPGGLATSAFGELQKFIREADFTTFDIDRDQRTRQISEPYSSLKQLSATATTKQSPFGWSVLIKVAAGAAPDPWIGAELVTARIDSKRTLATGWIERTSVAHCGHFFRYASANDDEDSSRFAARYRSVRARNLMCRTLWQARSHSKS